MSLNQSTSSVVWKAPLNEASAFGEFQPLRFPRLELEGQGMALQRRHSLYREGLPIADIASRREVGENKVSSCVGLLAVHGLVGDCSLAHEGSAHADGGRLCGLSADGEHAFRAAPSLEGDLGVFLER